jgi:hypothetical protein
MLALESLRRPWLTDVHFNNTTALATTSDGGGVTSAHSGRVLPVSVIFRNVRSERSPPVLVLLL